jgi:hypothetical protein
MGSLCSQFTLRTVAKLLERQRPNAEDQISRESGSMYDDYDDERSVGAAPTEVGMDWKERITVLLDRPAPVDPLGESEGAHSGPIDPYDAYRQILKDAEASAWLLSTLKRDLTLRGIAPSKCTLFVRQSSKRLEDMSPKETQAVKHYMYPDRRSVQIATPTHIWLILSCDGILWRFSNKSSQSRSHESSFRGSSPSPAKEILSRRCPVRTT